MQNRELLWLKGRILRCRIYSVCRFLLGACKVIWGSATSASGHEGLEFRDLGSSA